MLDCVMYKCHKAAIKKYNLNRFNVIETQLKKQLFSFQLLFL